VMAKAKGPYLGCLGLAAMWLAPLTLSGLDFGLGLIREGDWKEPGARLRSPLSGARIQISRYAPPKIESFH
jgi:hypothetical protein